MLIPAVHPGTNTVRSVPVLLIPSLSDCLFLAILLWVFAAGSGWSVLLADGDTGWHIRTGEYILDTRSVPVHDLFSFSKAGQPWFAWEWLSDVIFALLYRAWGLKGVVAFTGLVLSFSSALLYRYMMWRGANLLAALGATLLAAGASTVHYLARPHIFTLLGLTAAVWVLERDRHRPGRAVWWLVPMTAVWTNLHGGFLAWIACLGLVAAGSLWQAALVPHGSPQRFYAARRYAGLAAACALATFGGRGAAKLPARFFRRPAALEPVGTAGFSGAGPAALELAAGFSRQQISSGHGQPKHRPDSPGHRTLAAHPDIRPVGRLANANMQMVSIRQQIASAVHLLVQAARLSDGSRRVVSITEVTGMEGDMVTLQDIFVFEKRGVSAEGKVLGRFCATGIRPKFSEKLLAAGIHLPPELFDQSLEV
jgi:hypothetical protein